MWFRQAVQVRNFKENIDMTPPRAAEPRPQARSARDGEAGLRGGDFLLIGASPLSGSRMTAARR